MFAPVFPDAFAVIHRILSIKFRVAPAVMSKGRIMDHGWVCVPNHYNSFPAFIQRSVHGRMLHWEGEGNIPSDGMKLLATLPKEPVGLIGYSYGGLVVWWVSLFAPERVRTLVVIGSIPRKEYIPKRLVWMSRMIHPTRMYWWRNKTILSRLYSVCHDFPKDPPTVPTHWFLGKSDPYHNWRKKTLPNWSQVDFILHEGGTHPSEHEWSRIQKFS